VYWFNLITSICNLKAGSYESAFFIFQHLKPEIILHIELFYDMKDNVFKHGINIMFFVKNYYIIKV